MLRYSKKFLIEKDEHEKEQLLLKVKKIETYILSLEKFLNDKYKEHCDYNLKRKNNINNHQIIETENNVSIWLLGVTEIPVRRETKKFLCFSYCKEEIANHLILKLKNPSDKISLIEKLEKEGFLTFYFQDFITDSNSTTLCFENEIENSWIKTFDKYSNFLSKQDKVVSCKKNKISTKIF